MAWQAPLFVPSYPNQAGEHVSAVYNGRTSAAPGCMNIDRSALAGDHWSGCMGFRAFFILALLLPALRCADVDYVTQVKPILEPVHALPRRPQAEVRPAARRSSLALKGRQARRISCPARPPKACSSTRSAADERRHAKMPEEGDPLKPEEIALIRQWIDEGAKAPADEAIPVRAGIALGVQAAGAAGGAAGEERGLGAQPDRRVRRRRARNPRTVAAARGGQAGASPACHARPHRPAAHARRAARVSRRHFSRCIRKGRRPSARQPALRRTLGPALDGRLAIQRLGRLRQGGPRSASRTSGAGATGSSSRSMRTSLTTRWSARCSPATRSRRPIRTSSARRDFSRETGRSTTATGWMDEVVEHTSKAFLGLTFNCAKCHDHMFDPVTQREYFQFRAIFEPYDVRARSRPRRRSIPRTDGIARVSTATKSARRTCSSAATIEIRRRTR